MQSPEAVRAAFAVNSIIRNARHPPVIEGLDLHELRVNRHQGGALTELLRMDWGDLVSNDHPIAQAYVAVAPPGTIREADRWHVHEKQVDRIACLQGRVMFAVADARPRSATYGRVALVDFAATPDEPAPFIAKVPPGVLHGYAVYGTEPGVLINFPSRVYDGEDELRIPLSDAAVALPWGEPFTFEVGLELLSAASLACRGS